MAYYFTDAKHQQDLKKVMDEWLNTPYIHQSGVKHLGCDCIFFVKCVYEETGAIFVPRKLIPDYAKDWYMHNPRELIEEALSKFPRLQKVDNVKNLLNGDIIGYHLGQATAHLGIYFDNQVYQALNRIGVKKICFSDRLLHKRISFVYRLLE